MTDEALRRVRPYFERLYAKTGRPSIPPEKLLRALLLQALFSVRRERLLMEQLDYNLLLRWFVGLNMDDAIWDATESACFAGILPAAFSKQCSGKLVNGPPFQRTLHGRGTLLEAWARVKSFQQKDAKAVARKDDPGNPTVNFHGERRSNETHVSRTDPDAKLARNGPGKEAKRSYSGNLLVGNRNGLMFPSKA